MENGLDRDGTCRASPEGTDALVGTPRIVPGSHVTLHYRLSLGEGGGDVISTFGGSPATFQLGLGQLADSLEARLVGMCEGEQRRFALAPDEAYGARNPGLVQGLERAAFDAAVDEASEFGPGDVVELPRPGGGHYAGVLKSIDAQRVVFDFNHPLAGRALVFEVRILGVL